MGPFARCLIDEPDAPFPQVRKPLLDVVNGVGNMMHALTALLDEPGDRRVFRRRLEQLELDLMSFGSDGEKGDTDVLVGYVFDAVEASAEDVLIITAVLSDRAYGNADVVDGFGGDHCGSCWLLVVGGWLSVFSVQNSVRSFWASAFGSRLNAYQAVEIFRISALSFLTAHCDVR